MNQRRGKRPLLAALGLGAPLLLLVQLLTSCGSDDEGNACNPGDSHACVCSGDRNGTQICKDDGSGYSDCDCGSTGATGGSGGGTGTGGGGGGTSTAGSTGMPPGESLFPASVGQPCTSDASCRGAPLECIEASSNAEFATANTPGGGPQGGYCSLPCASDADCRAIDDISACNTALGYCFALCLPGATAVKCGMDRAQLCFPIVDDNSLGVCIPRCTSDAACGAGRFCDPGLLGLCVDQAPAGGKVGDPCTVANEATDCASGLCVEYTDPNNPNGVAGSFCSANCTFGLSNGCGFDTVSGGLRQAGCFQAQIRGGAPGDIGFCFPVCDTNADCAQAGDGWVCDPFEDANAVMIVGRQGECLPAVLANIGSADAGPG